MKRPDNFIDELSEILIRHHATTPEEIAVYKEQFSHSDLDAYEDFLLEEGLVEKEALLEALGAFYQVPWIDIGGILLDPDLVRNFPKDFLLRNEFIPIALEEDFLTVAAAHPDDETLLANIGRFADADVRFQIALPQDILDAVAEHYEAALTEVQTDEDRLDEEHEQDELERLGEIKEDDQEDEQR
jgi:hypothetical protein